MEPQRAGDYEQHSQVTKPAREPRFLNSQHLYTYSSIAGVLLSRHRTCASLRWKGTVEMEAYSERRLGCVWRIEKEWCFIIKSVSSPSTLVASIHPTMYSINIYSTPTMCHRGPQITPLQNIFPCHISRWLFWETAPRNSSGNLFFGWRSSHQSAPVEKAADADRSFLRVPGSTQEHLPGRGDHLVFWGATCLVGQPLVIK